MPPTSRAICRPALTLIARGTTFRRSGSSSPGPMQQRERICAAAAPDHGEITPWRFVIRLRRARRLAEVALALLDCDPTATLV
jgi:hypothetical protein